MSSTQEKIRGAEAPFTRFLWGEITAIRKAETEGDFATALDRAISLIAYLPEDAKEKFTKQADSIRKALQYLSQSEGGTDIFTNSVTKHRRMQKVSSALLNGFVKALTSYLDERGYMEWQPLKPRAKTPGKLIL